MSGLNKILGIKVGQTFVFDVDGIAIPVSIVKYHENVVTKILNKEKEGYSAVQLSILDKRETACNKSEIFRFKKAKTKPKYFSREVRLQEDYKGDIGEIINIKEIFKSGDIVDVCGTSKGKGFAGSIKRHNFSIGPKGHGSGYHRGSGSMGSIVAKKVFKGKKLPGRHGNKRTTVQNLSIVKIDEEKKYLLIKGGIPGNKKSLVIIRKGVKNHAGKVKTYNLHEYKAPEVQSVPEKVCNTEVSTDNTKKFLGKSVDDKKIIEKKPEITKETGNEKKLAKGIITSESNNAKKPVEKKVEEKKVDQTDKENSTKSNKESKKVEASKSKINEKKATSKKIKSEPKNAETKSKTISKNTDSVAKGAIAKAKTPSKKSTTIKKGDKK